MKRVSIFQLKEMIEMPFSYERISGTLINYFEHCHRQAWLFNLGLHLEDSSNAVQKGIWIDKNTFIREKEVEILGERIKADFINENQTPIEVHEVKASKIPRKDHEFQMGFYLQKLKAKGVEAVGIIHYPEVNKIVRVNLEKIKPDLDATLDAIVLTMNGSCPPRLPMKSCKGCAFYEFCYSIEEDADD